jgi:WD40 repeat protein
MLLAWPANSAAADPPPANAAALPTGALARLGQSRFRGAATVGHVAFSPDGKILATAARGTSGEIRLFDVRTGATKDVEPCEFQTKVLKFSSEGNRLYSSHASWGVADHSKSADDLPDIMCAISPDDRSGVSFDVKQGRVQIWDLPKGSLANSVPASRDFNLGSVVAFSPDGKLLAVGNQGGSVDLIDTVKSKIARSWTAPEFGAIRAVEFSPDGKWLAFAGEIGGVEAIDVESGQVRYRPDQLKHTGMVDVVRFSPDGKTLIAGGVGRTDQISIWNIQTGESIGRATAPGLWQVMDFAWSRDGTKAAAAGHSVQGNGLYVFDWKSRHELLPTTTARDKIVRIAFSPDGRRLATGSYSDEIQTWEIVGGRSLYRLKGACRTGIEFSPDGWILAASDQATYRLFAADNGEDLVQNVTGSATHMATGNGDVSFSPDLGKIAAATANGDVRIVSTATGAELHRFQLYQHTAIGSIAYSPDGRSLATCRTLSVGSRAMGMKAEPGQESIQFWDESNGLMTHELVSTQAVDQRGPVHGVYIGFKQLVFSPDGTTIAAAHLPTELFVFDLASERQVLRTSGSPNSFQYTPDGQMIVRMYQDGVEAVEVATGQVCFRKQISTEDRIPAPPSDQLIRPVAGMSAIAAAPDGRSFATVLVRDNSVYLWPLTPDGWHPSDKPHDDSELAPIWESLLAQDAMAANDAVWKLVESGNSAVAYIRRQIAPDGRIQSRAKEIRVLIDNLGSDFQGIREHAADELAKLGISAEPQLRTALGRDLSPVAQAEVRRILDQSSDKPLCGGESLRMLRTVRVLNQIDSESSTELLKMIAAGEPAAIETRNAKSILVRRLRAPTRR